MRAQDVPKRVFSVVILDDHPLFRRALVQTVREHDGTDVAAEFGSAADAVEAMAGLQADVCVMAIGAPETDPVLVLKELRRASPSTRVLVLTGGTQNTQVWSLLEEGAAGIEMKMAEADVIIDAIVAVANGDTRIPARLQRQIAEQIRMRRGESQIHLSTREIEILGAVAAGKSAAEIATLLSLAESTVKTHLTRIYDKLGVSERAAAVAEAMRRGLIE